MMRGSLEEEDEMAAIGVGGVKDGEDEGGDNEKAEMAVENVAALTRSRSRS